MTFSTAIPCWIDQTMRDSKPIWKSHPHFISLSFSTSWPQSLGRQHVAPNGHKTAAVLLLLGSSSFQTSSGSNEILIQKPVLYWYRNKKVLSTYTEEPLLFLPWVILLFQSRPIWLLTKIHWDLISWLTQPSSVHSSLCYHLNAGGGLAFGWTSEQYIIRVRDY